MDVLSTRALNRATLHRQLLLDRCDGSALDVVGHLIGLQAQAPLAPYYGLWSRLDGFRPDDLAGLLLDRKVVRIALMRGTVHLVRADDCLALRAHVQPVFDRHLRGNALRASGLAGVRVDELAEAGRSAVVERPLTHGELGAQLATRWADHTPAALVRGVRNLLPMVQVPPRGVWGKGGQPTLTTAQAWLGSASGGPMSLADLVVRYLGAFGPASVLDVQTWCGLTGLREVVDELRPRLRAFRDEDGTELVDLPDAPRPDPDVPAPVRYVAEFDNLTLSHADRTRVMSERVRKRLFDVPNGVFPGTVLVDGFVTGTWKIIGGRGAATLTVTAFRPLPKKHQSALVREGTRLLAFAHPNAATRDVRVVVDG